MLDLADPARPRQRGELHIPGFMFYLQPHGDRVIGLGVDRNDSGGSLNVSLFDVSNMDNPKMIKRVAFGGHTHLPGVFVPNREFIPASRIHDPFPVVN